jgi:hypothetical protein
MALPGAATIVALASLKSLSRCAKYAACYRLPAWYSWFC